MVTIAPNADTPVSQKRLNSVSKRADNVDLTTICLMLNLCEHIINYYKHITQIFYYINYERHVRYTTFVLCLVCSWQSYNCFSSGQTTSMSVYASSVKLTGLMETNYSEKDKWKHFPWKEFFSCRGSFFCYKDGTQNLIGVVKQFMHLKAVPLSL